MRNAVNAVNRSKTGRKLLKGRWASTGLHRFRVPLENRRKASARLEKSASEAKPTDETRGKVVSVPTCYGNRNHPAIGEDLVAVFEHNGIAVAMADKEVCCGMPKLELGDLEAVRKAKERNIPDACAWSMMVGTS